MGNALHVDRPRWRICQWFRSVAAVTWEGDLIGGVGGMGLYAGLLNAAPARLTQIGLEHIVARHWFTSGAKGAGEFIEEIYRSTSKSYIQ